MIYSCVSAEKYALEFSADFRRINVALTRAKHGMIMIGDFCKLKANDRKWKIMLEMFERDRTIANDLDEAMAIITQSFIGMPLLNAA